MSARKFTLEVLSGTFSICRLDPDAENPSWATGEIVSLTRGPDEFSIVCSQDNVPETINSEPGWRCLRVVGPLEFSLVGVIASLTTILATVDISVFVISTFDTDLLLLQQSDLETAVQSLMAAGHVVSS